MEKLKIYIYNFVFERGTYPKSMFVKLKPTLIETTMYICIYTEIYIYKDIYTKIHVKQWDKM